MGIYHLLDIYNLRQKYQHTQLKVTQLTVPLNILLSPWPIKNWRQENTLAGYTGATRVVRAQRIVKDVMRTILDMPSAT